MNKIGASISLGSIVIIIMVVVFASSAFNTSPVIYEDYPGYQDAIDGTPQAVMAYCGGTETTKPGVWTISGYFADCVVWLEIMREIEAGR